MIEHLTIDKLVTYGFLADDIERFKEFDNVEVMFHKTLSQRYWASNIEEKIYSGADASRKLYFKSRDQFYFPDDELSLIPEYFSLKRNKFLELRQSRAGLVYDESSAKERFMESEKEWAESELVIGRKQLLKPGEMVAKVVAKRHKENMEVYADWLKKYEEPPIEPELKPSIMKYLREITPKEFKLSHIHDEELMLHYEAALKKVKPELSLGTTIFQLPGIFKIQARWEYQLAERLHNAPSAQLAKDAFRQDWLDSLVYDDKLATDDATNEGRYYNKYRKISYDYAVKGLALTLKDLGYLVLKYQCGRPEGIEIIQSIMPVYGLDTLLVVLAEGTAIALYVHGSGSNQVSPKANEPALFKPGHDPATFLVLLRNHDYKILNDVGEYIYGRNRKSAVAAFFDVLDDRGIIYHHSAQKRAPLINKLIPELNISGRALDTYSALYAQMKPYFEAMLNDFLS